MFGAVLCFGCAGDAGTTGGGGSGASGGSGGTPSVGGNGATDGTAAIGGSVGTGRISGELGWCAAEEVGEGASYSSEIDLAVDANGSLAVVWRDFSSAEAVWFNRWTPDQGWGTPARLQAEEAPSRQPRVATDTNGNVIVVWDQSDCASSYDIWAKRWTVDEGWVAAERIDSEDGMARYPEIAIDKSGNAFVVWTQGNGVGAPRVWSSRWTREHGWGPAARLQSNDATAYDPKVAAAANGSAVATWREYDGEGIYSLWLSRWDAIEGWGAPEQVDAAQSVGLYDMALDSKGDALAVWSSGSGQGFDVGLWSARWAGAWEPPERVVDDRRTRDPKVAFDGSGNATAAWMYWGGADTGGARIWSGRWTPSQGWDDIVVLHDMGDGNPCGASFCTHGWSWDPTLAVGSNGSALVAWKEAEENEERQRLDVWSRKWTPDEGWTEAKRMDTRDGGVGLPAVAIGANGTEVVAWPQDRLLWATRYERGCNHDAAGGAGGGGSRLGGAGGVGGATEDLCASVICPDTECQSVGSCNANDGRCSYASVAEDGFACSEGECLEGGCGRAGAFACTEQGLRHAIALGGGPHYFACDEETPVVLAEPLVFDSEVILDGEGELTLEARNSLAIRVEAGGNAELRGLRARSLGYADSAANWGTLTVSDSSLDGVYNTSGALILRDTEVRRFSVRNDGGSATLTRVWVTDPESTYSGDGIYNSGGTFRLIDSTVTGSRPRGLRRAGGIFNTHHFDREGAYREGVLIIEGSTISNNTGYYAGAIYNNGGSVSLRDSTVSNNITYRGPSIESWTWRGGSFAVINSTISGAIVENECGSYFNGYGVGNDGDLLVVNSTIAGNAAGALDNRGVATVTNSILDGGCVQYGDDSTTTSGGHNVVGGVDSCGFDDATDMVEVGSMDLLLGPLAENGGPTMTHALLPGSVAIDVIPAPMCQASEDQRGEARPAGGMCDVGAFEVQP